MKFGKTSSNKQIIVGELRRSQFIAGAGSGAIVDMTKESVIMAGTDFWKHHEYGEYRITEENLQKYLGVEYFVTPTIKNGNGSEDHNLPAFRFPHWMFCPKCRRLAHEKTFSFTKHPTCRKCNKGLIPSRFVVACTKGHLGDFPYEWWVHEGQNHQCNGKPEMYFETDENSSGLESINIKCKTCERNRTMAKSFSKEFKCFGKRPWLKDSDLKECSEKARTLQRGATNLYFPINVSSLSIPPWSKQVQIELGKKWNVLNGLVNDKEMFINVVKSLGLDRQCNCDSEYIYDQAIIKLRNQNTDVEKTWKDILEDEYRAFSKGYSDDGDDGEFKIETESTPEVLADYIDSIVLAKKLREVMVLRGFKRITPDFIETDTESFNRLSREMKNWLPGIDLRGEGIFIKLNEQKLKKWEERYAQRYTAMEDRMENSMFKKPNFFSPRYVLLHTLSHLLIRELILQCGYSTASIKERIYSTFCNEDNPLDMSGILIYTSTNDSEGSLGGLVRQGTKERFETMFLQMLESASWCSSDPLCINSRAQGVDSLNYAACHSCSLLPETSCESRNCYLDRAAVVGTLDEGNIGYFRNLIEAHDTEVVYE